MGKVRTLEGYIVVQPKGYYDLTARYASRTPALSKDEIAIKLNISVPDALFTRPQLQASLTIPENAVTPPVLDATVLDNVREVIE
jgi:hypothetical protein